MNKIGKLSALAVALVIFVLDLPKLNAQYAPSGCSNLSDSSWQAQSAGFKKRDTLRAVAIWASSRLNLRGTKLPPYWRQIWDSSQQLSVPRFYRENSDSAGKWRYILNVDPYGRLSDSTCFVGGDYVSGNCVGDSVFVRKVLDEADSVIDFRNYDRDGDGYVDALFFVIYDSTAYSYYQSGAYFKGWSTLCFSGTYVTKDSVNGVPIKISSPNGVHAYTVNREDLVHTLSHEWGHHFGLLDYYAEDLGSWWVTGSFTVMGFAGFQYRASPFHPFQNHFVLGWDQPTDISTTSYNQQINPYFSSIKKSYRIKRNNTEYFEISYYPRVSFWEQKWPASGLLISHIREDQANPLLTNPKQIDLELPHSGGLRTYIGGTPDTCYPNCFTTPNDSTGLDSLDVVSAYLNANGDSLGSGPHYGSDIGSATCLWNASTKQYFDDKTNPSSRVYGSVGQNAFSKLAVENIQINGSTASADFIINAQYGCGAPLNIWTGINV